MKHLFNFRIEKEILEEFRGRHKNISGKLRELMLNDLKGSANIPNVKRDDIECLKKMIFEDDCPIQLIGDVRIGKTTSVQKLIKSDKEHIYIVFDSHNEYDLPEVQMISDDLKHNCKISLPKQISACRGLFPVYENQILSKKFPEKYVVIIEEANRFREIKELLREGRKFIKVIAVCQESLGTFCPRIEVVK